MPGMVMGEPCKGYVSSCQTFVSQVNPTQYAAFAYDAVLLLANVLQNAASRPMDAGGFDPMDGDALWRARTNFSGETDPPAVSGPIGFKGKEPWGRSGLVNRIRKGFRAVQLTCTVGLV